MNVEIKQQMNGECAARKKFVVDILLRINIDQLKMMMSILIIGLSNSICFVSQNIELDF